MNSFSLHQQRSPAQPARAERGAEASTLDAAYLSQRRTFLDATKLNAEIDAIIASYPLWAVMIGTSGVLAVLCVGMIYATFMVPIPGGNGASLWSFLGSLALAASPVLTAWIAKRNLPKIGRSQLEALKHQADSARKLEVICEQLRKEKHDATEKAARLQAVVDSLKPKPESED